MAISKLILCLSSLNLHGCMMHLVKPIAMHITGFCTEEKGFLEKVKVLVPPSGPLSLMSSVIPDSRCVVMNTLWSLMQYFITWYKLYHIRLQISCSSISYHMIQLHIILHHIYYDIILKYMIQFYTMLYCICNRDRCCTLPIELKELVSMPYTCTWLYHIAPLQGRVLLDSSRVPSPIGESTWENLSLTPRRISRIPWGLNPGPLTCKSSTLDTSTDRSS